LRVLDSIPKKKKRVKLAYLDEDVATSGSFYETADLLRRAPHRRTDALPIKKIQKKTTKKKKRLFYFDKVNILWFSTFHFVRFQVRVVFSIDGEHPPEGRSVDVAAAHAFEGLSFRPLFDALQKGRTALGTLRAPKRKSFRALTGLHYKLLSTN